MFIKETLSNISTEKLRDYLFVLSTLTFIIGFIVNISYIVKYNLSSYELFNARYLQIGIMALLFIVPILTIILYLFEKISFASYKYFSNNLIKLFILNLLILPVGLVFGIIFALLFLFLVDIFTIGNINNSFILNISPEYSLAKSINSYITYGTAHTTDNGTDFPWIILPFFVFVFVLSYILQRKFVKALIPVLGLFIWIVSLSLYTSLLFYLGTVLLKHLGTSALPSQDLFLAITGIFLFIYLSIVVLGLIIGAHHNIPGITLGLFWKNKWRLITPIYFIIVLILYTGTIFPSIPFNAGGGKPRKINAITTKSNKYEESTDSKIYILDETSRYIFLEIKGKNSEIKQIPTNEVIEVSY